MGEYQLFSLPSAKDMSNSGGFGMQPGINPHHPRLVPAVGNFSKGNFSK